MAEGYYVSRKESLLRQFDKTIARVRSVFEARYGRAGTEAMVAEARQEYERLIPELPYVGGRQPFTQFVIFTGWFLAMYRTLQRHGRTVEEAGVVGYKASKAYLKSYPRFMRRLLGFMTFSPIYLKRLQARAQESQARPYPDGYVYRFVPGDGETFDYGVDYEQCATCKFLEKQGASELAPYLCAADELYSEMLGWGLVRTTTLAEGYERCDFRFKRGGETRVVVPQALRDAGCRPDLDHE